MKKEPAWMDEIRQQMKNTRFYGQMEEERDKYKMEYLKILETLDAPRAESIRQYVEWLQMCEYHHIRTAYLQGMEDEKSNHKVRRDDYYKIITSEHMLKGAVVAKAMDLLLSWPEFSQRCDAMEKKRMDLFALMRNLTEEEKSVIVSYLDAISDFYAILFHTAAGLPRGML